MENKPKHIGIYIDDMTRAKKFYANLFGWNFNSYGPSDFFQIKSDNEVIGALQSRKYSPIEQKVIGYECTIAVKNIDQTIELISENGGNIVLPKTEIPSVGWVTKFLDTEGNLVCAMEYHKKLNKTEIKNALIIRYSSFLEYISVLSDDEFLFTHQSKWSAGQQLKHIVLCINPLVHVYGMSNTLIEKNFGTTETQSRTYDQLLADYLEKLKQGGKAPNQYVPEIVSENERSELLKTLPQLIEKLNTQIEVFTERQLDTLCIPHPVLGNISLREMLYNAIYHVEHHQKQIENNLNKI